MSIKTKLFSLLIAVEVLFVVGLYTIEQTEASRLRNMFAERVEHESVAFNQVVEMLGSNIRSITKDYSSWDEMVDFVHHPNPKWAKENMDDSLSNYRVNYAWILDEDISLKYYWASPPYKDTNLKLYFSTPEMKEFFKAHPFSSFYAYIDNRLIEFHSASIQPITDQERISPPHGYLILAVVWDNTRLSELATIMAPAKISIVKNLPTITGPSNLKEGTINTYKVLSGIDGKPTAFIFMAHKLESFSSAYTMWELELLAYLLFSAVVLVIIYLGVFIWVGRPLRKVIASLDKGSAEPLQHLVASQSEFGRLARLIAEFFVQKEILIRTIDEQNKSEAKIKMSEERFRTLVSSTQDTVFTLDNNGDCTYFYPGQLAEEGLTQEDLLGKTMHNLLTGRGNVHGSKIISAMSGRSVAYEWDLNITGYLRRMHTVLSPLRGPGGEVQGVVGIARDITDIAMVREKLLHSEEELRIFSRRMINVREEEKKKLAHYIHDEFGSHEAALSSLITIMQDDVGQSKYGELPENMAKARQILKDLIVITKNVSSDLRPPGLELAGLTGAVKELARKTAQYAGKEIGVESTLDNDDFLPENIKILFFRIVQESLSNAVKHSGASKIMITLAHAPKELVIEIADNGKGMPGSKPPSPSDKLPHFGLASIKEYAKAVGAKLDIISAEGKGTAVRVIYPIKTVEK